VLVRTVLRAAATSVSTVQRVPQRRLLQHTVSKDALESPRRASQLSSLDVQAAEAHAKILNIDAHLLRKRASAQSGSPFIRITTLSII
jgi:predicted RNase H-like nuclease